MQRLFSTFANGWPGRGLLLLRLLTAAVLLRSTITHIGVAASAASIVLQIIAACAGILLLAGLWTPVAGTVLALVELCVVFLAGGEPLVCIILATLGATLGMIGPGAWSVDARLFGRKHIDAPRR